MTQPKSIHIFGPAAFGDPIVLPFCILNSPIFQVSVEWEEHLDSSGRKYYYNIQTREKSWKPPRRTRGSSEGIEMSLKNRFLDILCVYFLVQDVFSISFKGNFNHKKIFI